MATHIFTSAAANYLPKARVLAQSVRQFHPDWKIHLVLCDELPSGFYLPDQFDTVWTLADLKIPNLKSWLFQHTLVEASTAVKGFALRKLLSLPDCDHVLYFDPDIVLLSPLHHLIREFEKNSVLLTPHLSEPETTDQAIVDNELSVLRHGIYNLGFVGVKNSLEGHRFADWWCGRLQSFCFDDIPLGLFTDQRWADLVPAYFSEFKILRDPVYNVCTWNLTHRMVSGSLGQTLLVNGEPIAFYHFSGFDSGAQQSMLDRYGSSMPSLYELREWYVRACENADGEGFSRLSWAYDFFSSGDRILRLHRKRYRESPAIQALFPDPFRADESSETFLGWFNLHDEFRFEPQVAESLPEALPEYRIVVIATRQDAAFALDTCRVVLRSSHNCSNLAILIDSEATLTGAIPPEFKTVTEKAAGYSRLFAAAVHIFGDKDLLMIRAGGVPPAFWDLRLAWSAARQSGVLSVAPLDRRLLDSSGVLGRIDNETLDCLSYWYRPSIDLEAATLETDCIYIRAAALADVTGSRSTTTVSDLLGQSTRLRYTNLLATHVCVAWNVPRQALDTLEVPSTNRWSIKHVRNLLRAHRGDETRCPIPAVMPGTQPTLHFSHSWGGGVERWLSEFIGADKITANLVLKSQGPHGSYGTELGLYRYRFNAQPELLETWALSPIIKATGIRNETYAAVLRELFEKYQFGRVLVSSVIGHSLECLTLPVPTAVVCHDYYPFCSAINLTFGEVCPSCEPSRLRACLEENPFNHSFPNVPVPEWLAIRSEFVRLVNERELPMIAPSPSVKENYSRALPEIADRLRVIPHGTSRVRCETVDLSSEEQQPLRILVLGSMAIHKGRLLLEAMLPDLLGFAEITLAGCFDFPDRFLPNPRIRVIPSYTRESLCELVGELRPEVGLLLSVVPEAFSYTLRELQMMWIPPVATRMGSFEDWIKDGETGFLADPQPAPLLNLLRSLAQDRSRLQAVHRNLRGLSFRSPEEMVRDYRELSVTKYSARLYFEGPSAPPPMKDRGLQLYWRTADQGFSEQNSVVAFPRGSSRQTLRLDFVAPVSAVAELRLDLATRPGFVLLHGIALLGRKEETLWSLHGTPETLQGVQLVQCLIVNEGARSGDGVLVCLFGNDPHLILPIPPAAFAESKGAGTIEVDFTPEPDTQISTESASGQKDNALAALQFRIDELTGALTQARAERSAAELQAQELHHLRAQLAQREEVIDALQQSVSWKITKPLRTIAHAARKTKT